MSSNLVLLRFDRLLAETNKAILIKVGNSEHWLPKKLCIKLIVNKKLGGNAQLPEWLYIEKFGTPDEKDYTVKVTHHIPEKIDSVHSNIIERLKK